MSSLSIIYFIYFILWGFLYYRKPIAETRALDIENIRYDELLNLTKKLINLANSSRNNINDIEAQSLNIEPQFTIASIGFKTLANQNKVFNYTNSSIKFAFSKPILSAFNTTGIYSFWSGEANINANNPTSVAPFTICHEMAHQIGFASEEEANYIAYLACVHNPNKIFQYAAHNQALKYSLGAVFQKDSNDYHQLKQTISPKVMADYHFASKQWEPYNYPIINKISSKIYDLFLKANNQDQGIESYGQVVNLLIAENRKNGIK
jgi:hypothetical protein